MRPRSRSGFDRLVPVSDRYAALPVVDAFTWEACRADVDPGEWYLVAFRSVHRHDADEARLTAYDDWAHEEAMHAPGFVHYFKGPTALDGTCLSFCLWDSRADARAAAGQQHHIAAAALVFEMYERYELEFHRVRLIDGAFAFEDYDRPSIVLEPGPTIDFMPGLAPA